MSTIIQNATTAVNVDTPPDKSLKEQAQEFYARMADDSCVLVPGGLHPVHRENLESVAMSLCNFQNKDETKKSFVTPEWFRVERHEVIMPPPEYMKFLETTMKWPERPDEMHDIFTLIVDWEGGYGTVELSTDYTLLDDFKARMSDFVGENFNFFSDIISAQLDLLLDNDLAKGWLNILSEIDPTLTSEELTQLATFFVWESCHTRNGHGIPFTHFNIFRKLRFGDDTVTDADRTKVLEEWQTALMKPDSLSNLLEKAAVLLLMWSKQVTDDFLFLMSMFNATNLNSLIPHKVFHNFGPYGGSLTDNYHIKGEEFTFEATESGRVILDYIFMYPPRRVDRKSPREGNKNKIFFRTIDGILSSHHQLEEDMSTEAMKTSVNDLSNPPGALINSFKQQLATKLRKDGHYFYVNFVALKFY